jgi:hypothetical protein
MCDYMATTISISEETREMLKMYGRKDETYDKILNKLMELAKRQLFYDEQAFILKNEKFYNVDDI